MLFGCFGAMGISTVKLLVSSHTRRVVARRLVSRCLNNVAPLCVPESVKIVEVGPRDGLQNERSLVSVKDKVELITKLAYSGCSYIEAGSFVSPKAVPAMGNSLEVMKIISDPAWRERWNQDVVISCLVPTIKYFHHALDVKVDEIAIFASASETFSQKNLNCGIQESIDRFILVTDAAKSNGIPVRGYLSCVIACPYEGKIQPKKVAEVADMLYTLGCHEISLGDTIGVGTPGSTIDMLDSVLNAVGNDTGKLAVHFHDTYGQALSNIMVSLERGIRTIDSSVAGLGGCPYAKGATGNVATEDVVYMLHGMGVHTGIDLDKLIDAGDFICNVLGRSTSSKVANAILFKRP